MKKVLLLLGIVLSASIATIAQCSLSLSNVSVQLVGVPTAIGPNKTKATFNIQFDLSYNPGGKYVYIHSYLAADYPSPAAFSCNGNNTPAVSPPTHTQLGTAIDDIGKSFIDIGLDNSAGHGALNTPVPVTVLTSYSPDPTVVLIKPSNSPGMTVAKTFTGGSTDHFVMKNVTVIFNQSWNTTMKVKTDVWASNANSANSAAQCYICGAQHVFNDPTITGFKVCSVPRTLTLGLQTTSATPITVSYNLYKSDGDAAFEPGTEDTLVGSGGPYTISAGSPWSATNISYTGNNAKGEKSDIWVAVTSSQSSNTILALFSNLCSSLPVNLTYFYAKRSSANNVNLTWQTAQEINSSGFEIQRKIGGGSWQVIAFVQSKAINGNSNSPLNYSYVDNNSANAITEYRLRTVDIDGSSKFSDIRSVRGEGQAGSIIMYPNPSADGKVKVIFDDISGTRDVSLTDMSGRLIRQWAGVTNNNLEISNIPAGYYSLRVINRETGEQSVEKMVVKQH
ncbi:MAG TPA: T9SS type A sorting domain-containing protein [Chitinophagaceae bacterium]|jgi:type IX secretion system substrate protein|nr:T9SS type A sorting domain-containing protein [Chitinophagaceae bacterium]